MGEVMKLVGDEEHGYELVPWKPADFSDYQTLHKLCVAFRKLGNQEFQIFEFLFSMDYFEGNLVDLAKAVHMDISAARKAVLRLQDKYRIVYAGKEEGKQKYKVFFVVDGWMDNILESTKDIKNPLENVKRTRIHKIKE